MKVNVDEFMKKFNERKGLKEEEKLFSYLDYAVRDENFNEPTFLRKGEAIDRYIRVKELLNKTSKEIKNSNIYLKKCDEFIDSVSDDAAELLLDYRDGEDFDSWEVVSTRGLLDKVEEKSNQDKEYNKVCDNVEKMYIELVRLNIWNMINDSDEDIATVSLKKSNNNTGILTAKFQDISTRRVNLGKIYNK